MKREPVPELARLLPAGYPERLADAAARGDHQAVDDLTDELALRYPKLVRPRSDVGRFTTLSPVAPRRATC
jgi:hypothetical protein